MLFDALKFLLYYCKMYSGDSLLLKTRNGQQREHSAEECRASLSQLQSSPEQSSIHQALDAVLSRAGTLWFCLCCRQYQKAQISTKVQNQISLLLNLCADMLTEQPGIRNLFFSSLFCISNISHSCLLYLKTALRQTVLVCLCVGPPTGKFHVT